MWRGYLCICLSRSGEGRSGAGDALGPTHYPSHTPSTSHKFIIQFAQRRFSLQGRDLASSGVWEGRGDCSDQLDILKGRRGGVEERERGVGRREREEEEWEGEG